MFLRNKEPSERSRRLSREVVIVNAIGLLILSAFLAAGVSIRLILSQTSLNGWLCATGVVILFAAIGNVFFAFWRTRDRSGTPGRR